MPDPQSGLTPQRRQRVEKALPLVEKIAGKVNRRIPALTRDELISAGSLALVECARRHDPESGSPFQTYAYGRVHGAMLDERDRMRPELRRYRRAMKRAEAAAALQTELEASEAALRAHDPRTPDMSTWARDSAGHGLTP